MVSPLRLILLPLSLLISVAALGDETASSAAATPAPEETVDAAQVEVAVQNTPDALDPNTPTDDSPGQSLPREQVNAQDPNEPAPEIAPATAASPADTTPAEATPRPEPKAEPEPEPEPEMTMADVVALLKAQQAQIDKQQGQLKAQQELLDNQTQQISTLTRELDVLRAPSPVAPPRESIVAKAEQDSMPVAVAASTPGQSSAGDLKEIITNAEQQEKNVVALDSVARAQEDDPTRAMLEDFVGAWRLPGTDAALSVGGFVKSNLVYNWDPLEINDRFIVGSIPVGVDGGKEAQSSITANQSRLNFDLREPTEYGLFRAFVEGDFAEDGDTFRLRHAFGQWRNMLAGKTWSAFVDTQASPEEVDFEGLNGRISLRQSQVRITPTLGKEYEFQFSLEDPNPRVQNGEGVTRAPDFVFSGRFEPYESLHTKVALLLRQIRAQREADQSGGVEKEYAWGLTVSGRYRIPYWDERDSLLFQVNAGDGIGRYVNDLSSVGSFDGIFNPENGDLELFDILSGYVSFQHWWAFGGSRKFRSNFTLGYVGIDNPNFIEGEAYKRTIRASTNLFWSPTPRIDIGGEYLWGKRENEDGNNADATQLQLAVRYRF